MFVDTKPRRLPRRLARNTRSPPHPNRSLVNGLAGRHRFTHALVTGNNLAAYIDEPLAGSGAFQSAEPAEHPPTVVGVARPVTLRAHAPSHGVPSNDLEAGVCGFIDGYEPFESHGHPDLESQRAAVVPGPVPPACRIHVGAASVDTLLARPVSALHPARPRVRPRCTSAP